MAWFSDIMDKWALKKIYKWSRGRARFKLFAFNSIQAANPEMSAEDLYYLTVLTSRGFNEHRTGQLIKRVKEQAKGYMSVGYSDLTVDIPDMFVEPFCLRSVIKMMLLAEESDLTKGVGFPHPDSIFEVWKAVDDVIPANL